MKTLTNLILRATFALAAAAAGFAAATIPANAQQAQMSVFARTSGDIEFDRPSSEGEIAIVNFAQNLADFAADVSARVANPPIVYPNIIGFTFFSPSSPPAAAGTTPGTMATMLDENHLPVFPDGVVEAGDRIIIHDRPSSSFSITGADLVTVRIYDADPGPDVELAMATVVGLSATVDGDNFFLNTLDPPIWQPTTMASTNNVGYTEPTCTNDRPVLSDDGLRCEVKCTGDQTVSDDGSRCEVECTGNETVSEDGMSCEIADGGGNNNGGGGSDNHNDSSIKIAGVAGVVAFMYAFYEAEGDVDAFSFSPDFGYAITESGYSYKYGGRVDFRKDAWSLYWTAGQRNADGDWGDLRYESGGEYDGGFWRASFSERATGDAADYDFSLSADYSGGIWKVSPEFYADARYEDGEFAMTNSFRISGELRFDDWRLSAAGNAERVRLSAVRRF